MANTKRSSDGAIDGEKPAKKIMFEEGADATAPVNRKDDTDSTIAHTSGEATATDEVESKAQFALGEGTNLTASAAREDDSGTTTVHASVAATAATAQVEDVAHAEAEGRRANKERRTLKKPAQQPAPQQPVAAPAHTPAPVVAFRMDDRVYAPYGKLKHLYLGKITRIVYRKIVKGHEQSQKAKDTDGPREFVNDNEPETAMYDVTFRHPQWPYSITVQCRYGDIHDKIDLPQAPHGMTDEKRKSTDQDAPNISVGMTVQAKFTQKKKLGGGTTYLIAQVVEIKARKKKDPLYVVTFMHNGEVRDLDRRYNVPMYVDDDADSSLVLDEKKQDAWPVPELPKYENVPEMSNTRTQRRMEAHDTTYNLPQPPANPKRMIGGQPVNAWFDIDTLYEANVGEISNAVITACRQTDPDKVSTGLLDVTDVSMKTVVTFITPLGQGKKHERAFVRGHISKILFLFIESKGIWIRIIMKNGDNELFAMHRDSYEAAMRCVRLMRLKMKDWLGGVTVAPSIDLSTARSTYAYSSVYENGVHGTDYRNGATICERCTGDLLPDELEAALCKDCVEEADEPIHKHRLVTETAKDITPDVPGTAEDDGFDNLAAGIRFSEDEGVGGGFEEGLDDGNELSDED